MTSENKYVFEREIKRDTITTIIAFTPFIIKERKVKVLEAGLKKIPDRKGYMLAYVVLDKNDEEIASIYLDRLQNNGTI